MTNNRVSSVLTLEEQKLLSFSGVESVDGFSPSEINLTVAGKKVRIAGTNLKVQAFSKGSGAFSAIGEISSIRFGRTKGKFFQRLFR